MKFSKIVLSVVFAIIFSNIAYCDTLYKEQTVINKQKNIIEYISSDGNTTHKTLEKNSFFVDKNGFTYMQVQCLDNVLNKNLEYKTDRNILTVNDKEKNLITLNTELSVATTGNNSFPLTKNIIKKDENIYVPFRNILNLLGYDDTEIFYNSSDKTISIGNNQIFKTNLITVSSELPYFQTKIFNVADQKAIDTLVGTLNKEPFFEANTNIGSSYAYTLDFNNGTVLKIKDSDLTVGSINKNNYQLTFNAAKNIEDFIRNNTDLAKNNTAQWKYNLTNEELYKKEYITCNYMQNDYGRLIDYIKNQIPDLDKKYTYYFEKKGSRAYIKFKSYKTGKIYSKQVYEYPAWISRMNVDAFIKSELEAN